MEKHTSTKAKVLSKGAQHEVEIDALGDSGEMVFTGALSENSDLIEVFRLLEKDYGHLKSLGFDLSNVQRINSSGTREWLRFLQKAGVRYKVRFRSLGEAFIEQANMIPGMLGSGLNAVEEVMAPFACPKCKNRELVAMRPAEVAWKGKKWSVPRQNCSQCSTVMEFDEGEEYFSFLQRKD